MHERRNPFRFGPAGWDTHNVSEAEAHASVTEIRGIRANPTPTIPPVAASSSPAALRVVGFVEARNRLLRVAVLTDGDGIYYGAASDVVKGRYRILAVSGPSIQIEDMVHGTRMTLRLIGS